MQFMADISNVPVFPCLFMLLVEKAEDAESSDKFIITNAEKFILRYAVVNHCLICSIFLF